MTDALQTAQQNIQRFESLGGVSLSSLDPEERHDFQAIIQIGLANYKKGIFWFVCEECGNLTSSDMDMEPMCTGPSWTNDHPPTVMTRKN